MSTPDQPDPRRWQALWVCLIAGFMTLLDVSIVNVALPAMQRGVGASSAELSWVVSGYALTFGLVLVSSGRLGDDRGRKKVFLIALALFTLTSAAAGLAQDPTWLVVTRLLQGVAGGMLNPQVIGVIQQLFSGRERGRAFGLFGAAIGVSTAIGPLLGGLLLEWGGEAEGWRWVFYVNVPIGIVALVLGARLLPRDEPRSAQKRPLDVIGAVLLGGAVVCLMLPLVLAERDPAAAPWWLLGVTVLLLIVFVVWEHRARRRHGHPLVNFSLLRTRSYALGTTLGLLYFAGFTAIFFVVTLFFQQGRGYTPLEAGLALTPFAVGSAVSSWLGGRWIARFGKPQVVVGLVMVAVGLVATDLVLGLDPAHVGWAVAGPLLLAGIGSGLVIAPNQTLALADVPPREGGTAAGVLQTGQRVGSAIGISAVGAVFFAELTGTRGDWASSISRGLVGAVAFVVLALLVGVADLVADRVARTRRARAATAATTTAAATTTVSEGHHRSVELDDGAHGGDVGAPRPPSEGHHRSVELDEGPHGQDAGVGPADHPAPVPASGIGGRVVRADGTRVDDAVLTLVDAAGRQSARGETGSDGRFGLDAPSPGVYQLVVRAPGHRPEVGWVRVGDGRTEHDVALSGTPDRNGHDAPSPQPPTGSAGRHHAGDPGRPVG